MGTDSQETFELSQIIFQAIEKKLCDVNIKMPGKISSYDDATNMAVVQPAFKRKYRDEDTPINLPTISNVPVIFPRMGDAHLVFPVKPGQEGELHFHQRSIDGWLETGGEVDPIDNRKFSLSDCTFHPGLTSKANPLKRKGSPSNVELAHGKAFIEMFASGKFKIGDGDEELFALISDLADECSKILTNTALGPQAPINAAAFTALKVKIDSLKG